MVAVARDLELTEPALREWGKRAQADRTKGGTCLTTAEREEIARLRKENAHSLGRARNSKKPISGGRRPTCVPETQRRTLAAPGLWPPAFW